LQLNESETQLSAKKGSRCQMAVYPLQEYIQVFFQILIQSIYMFVLASRVC